MTKSDVIKGLQCCMYNEYTGQTKCPECPYRGQTDECLNALHWDAACLIDDLIGIRHGEVKPDG